MRLLEAILRANHQALTGDHTAGLRPDDHAASLPLIALTCIDPRLNSLLPEVLGIPESQFIWLRNAGNIITGPMSSTMRSLALACAIKGGREIAIIGHSDCQACRTTMMQLLERLQTLGVKRQQLPEDLHAFFGLNASERQVVLRGVEFARQSPLIGPTLPIHGLWLDTDTGRLEWVSNGYETLQSPAAMAAESSVAAPPSGLGNLLQDLAPFTVGEMKFPSESIGEKRISSRESPPIEVVVEPATPPPPPRPQAIPVPPPIPVKRVHWKHKKH